MPYYDECPLCGSTLDPCESCDCVLTQSPIGDSFRREEAEIKKPLAHLGVKGANGNPIRELSSDISISQRQGNCQG